MAKISALTTSNSFNWGSMISTVSTTREAKVSCDAFYLRSDLQVPGGRWQNRWNKQATRVSAEWLNCHEVLRFFPMPWICLWMLITFRDNFHWRMTILLWTWTKSYWRRSKIKRWPTGTSPLYSTQCGCLAYCLAYCFDRFFDRFMRFHDDLVELQRLEKNSAIQQLAGHFSCMPPYWMGPPLLDAKAVRSFDMQLY